MFWKSTYNELIKIAAKPRSYIGIGVITIIVVIILAAMKADGESFISYMTGTFENSFSFEGKVLNGNLIAYFILQTLFIHVPLLIALVTGDLISGEAAMGTIRLLVTRPVSRTKILFSKFIAGCAYTFVMVLWLVFMALVVGKVLFGEGDLMVFGNGGLIIFQENDIFWRFVSGFALSLLSMIMVATLSLTLSCFSDNSIGPIVSTMAIIILFNVVGAIDVPVLQSIKPFLFTSHMTAWGNFFTDPLSYKKILYSSEILLIHIVVLLIIAVYKFNKKDILS